MMMMMTCNNVIFILYQICYGAENKDIVQNLKACIFCLQH